jgi:phospholipid/cholesterol/gamma-HCH transport system substrate-binding protein
MKNKHEIGVGLLMVAAVGLLAWMSLKVGAFTNMGEAIQVQAVFDDAAGLQDGAAVSVAGVEVGTVSGLTVDFDKAVVGLRIQPDAGIRSDVQVHIRARSVLGEKYLELVPLSRDAALIQDGALITDTHGQVEIDQLVTALGPLVKQVNGLDTEKFQALIEPFAQAIEEDPERPKRMLNDLEVTLHNARLASEALPALMDESRRTLAQVRGASQDASDTLEKADALLVTVGPVLTDIQVGAERVPALTEELELTLSEARVLLASLQNSTESLEIVLKNFEEIDQAEIERLMREEGVKVRLIERKGD